MAFEGLRVGRGDFEQRNLDRRQLGGLRWFIWNPFESSCYVMVSSKNMFFPFLFLYAVCEPKTRTSQPVIRCRDTPRN